MLNHSDKSPYETEEPQVGSPRCDTINDALEIHYWTGPEPGAACECGETTRPTPEQREAAKRANFAEWFARQPGARLERR